MGRAGGTTSPARPRAAVPSVPSSTGGNSAARSERATNAARRGTTTTAHAALLYCRRPYQQHIPAPKCYAYREFLRSRVPSSRRSPAARTIIVGSTGPPSISRSIGRSPRESTFPAFYCSRVTWSSRLRGSITYQTSS